MTKIEDLRIVKLYRVAHVEKDYFGQVSGIETSKAVPYFVLVKKVGNKYKAVPTNRLTINTIIREYSDNEHALIINKMAKNNRYRKPHHLNAQLNVIKDRKLELTELQQFAEKIQNVNANLPAAQAEEQLKLACASFANSIIKKSSYNYGE